MAHAKRKSEEKSPFAKEKRHAVSALVRNFACPAYQTQVYKTNDDELGKQNAQ